jgi:hypothetical protein
LSNDFPHLPKLPKITGTALILPIMSFQSEPLDFSFNKCFITGLPLSEPKQEINIFPEWLLQRYQLKDKLFKLLEGTMLPYQELKVPCSPDVLNNAILPLEERVQQAFTEGYDAVKALPEEVLFQWMAKIVFGIAYLDICIASEKEMKKGGNFRLPPPLLKRLSNLRLMLQSLVSPTDFEGEKPWSIAVFRVNYSKDIFNFRDDPINLFFSLGINGFGIVACLGDNGAVQTAEQPLLDKLADKKLHPVQFEEVCARFVYRNYLLKTQAGYTVEMVNGKRTIKATASDAARFHPWSDDMFSQVLADYWKPWGLAKKDIVRFAEAPISYLQNDYTNEIIEPESIELPF